MVTAMPGVVLCILHCRLRARPAGSTRSGASIGAPHAGWRGTLAGIVGAGVRAMVAAGAEASAISARLGPSIGPCCFEVDAELAEELRSDPVSSSRTPTSVRAIRRQSLSRPSRHYPPSARTGGPEARGDYRRSVRARQMQSDRLLFAPRGGRCRSPACR